MIPNITLESALLAQVCRQAAVEGITPEALVNEMLREFLKMRQLQHRAKLKGENG